VHGLFAPAAASAAATPLSSKRCVGQKRGQHPAQTPHLKRQRAKASSEATVRTKAAEVAKDSTARVRTGRAGTVRTKAADVTAESAARTRFVTEGATQAGTTLETVVPARAATEVQPLQLPRHHESAEVAGQTQEVSEEDRQRRRTKRTTAVAAIKGTPEYAAFADSRFRGCVDASGAATPRTPDPYDDTVSKRSWETSVMNWRRELRDWCRIRGHEFPD